MKRLFFLKNSLLVFTLIFALGACNDDGDDSFDAISDVIFVHKVIDNTTVTGVAYYAYGNKTLSSASVTLPDGGGTIDLEAYASSSYTFLKEPEDSDFSSEEPSEGTYTFNIKSSSGDTLKVSDTQDLYGLSFAQIDSSNFDTENNWLYIGWGDVSGADSYSVKLLDASGNIVFNGYTIGSANSYYIITTSANYDVGEWESNPVKGTTYTLRIQSTKYDSGYTSSDYIYNVQEASYSDSAIEWTLDD